MSKQQKKILKYNILDEFFGIACRHPIVMTVIMCLAAMAMTTLSTGSMPNPIALAGAMALMLFCALCAIRYVCKNSIKPDGRVLTFFALTVISVMLLIFVYSRMYTTYANIGLVWINFSVPVIICTAAYLYFNDILTTRNKIIILFLLGFILRLAYVIYTYKTQRQHDVSYFSEDFSSEHGHAGYIEYIYNNLSLPDIDVRTVSQFYHPPLHHILAAIWMKIQTAVGVSYLSAAENIQILTLFYSSLCMILSYKIFKQLGIKGNGLVCAFAITAFCPTFFIMAGSINNDILSITFMLGAILNTIYWYNNQKLRYIIAIALCVGLGMMTKLSVWMVAPAIAFVFLYVFFRNIKSFKKYLAQFGIFAVICVPLGLWWGIRNYISYGVPFTYVPMLSDTSSQYVGDIPILQRLFDFSLDQFADVGDQFTMYGGSYNEYNPLIALFKTSDFDEGITVSNYSGIAGFNQILFWASVLLGILGFISLIYNVFIKRNTNITNVIMNVFLFIIYAVILASYYIFCIEYPHVCTQNIRYAVPLIVIGAYFIGALVKTLSSYSNSEKKSCMLLKRIVYTVTAVYCSSSFVVYYIVAIESFG